MPRPKLPRIVSAYPTISAFVPQGMPVSGELLMTVEELEAIRLSDFERLDQETAAERMGVSRHTFGRVLSEARGKVADALITAKRLRVEGGHFEVRGAGRRRRRRGGRGRGGFP